MKNSTRKKRIEKKLQEIMVLMGAWTNSYIRSNDGIIDRVEVWKFEKGNLLKK